MIMFYCSRKSTSASETSLVLFKKLTMWLWYQVLLNSDLSNLDQTVDTGNEQLFHLTQLGEYGFS